MLPLVVATLLAAPTPDARWGLRWQAPLECVQAADLARAVEARLGRSVFGPAPEFTIDGVMHSGTKPRWKAQFTLVDAHGTVLGAREVGSDEGQCGTVTPSLALVVAVMIDPSAALGAPVAPEPIPPPPAEVVQDAPEPIPDPTPIVHATPAELHPLVQGTRGEVLFGASGAYGLGLSASLGAQITVHVRWLSSSAVEWWVGLMPRDEIHKDGGLGAVHWLQTALTLCPLRVEGGPAMFTVCGGVGGTLMLTYTEGYQQGVAGFLARPDAVARARLRLAFGTFALSVGVVGGLGPVRPVLFLMKPNGASELLPVGSWGWGGVELAVGSVWQ